MLLILLSRAHACVFSTRSHIYFSVGAVFLFFISSPCRKNVIYQPPKTDSYTAQHIHISKRSPTGSAAGMEANELLMCVDVKMDTREKLIDYLNLRTWTKFFLKVEPIRCFPCHLRISMMHHNAEISSNLTIRINVPGINVQMATSRKKQHICSLSWTYNQRCTIFLSFDSKVSCEKHVKWLQMAIQDLELYSQQLIASKRHSRASTVDESEKPSQLYENIWETRGMRSYGDTQRTSGIYEEIPDAKAPRASIVSGIYEEMLPVETDAQKVANEMPPPLPPRTRMNTFESGIPRSFTNPESEVLKKRRYRTMLDNVLGLGRRTSKDKKGKKSESLSTKFLSLDITQGKRNSFSSPNLTKMTRSVSESDAMTQYQCGTSVSDDFFCHESYLNTVSSQPETKTPFEDVMDDRRSVKSSVADLLHVETPVSSQETLPETENADQSVSGAFNSIYFKFQDERGTPDGYLEMGPAGFDREKVKELDRLESQQKVASGYVEMNGSGFSPEAVQELDRLEAAASVDYVSNVTFLRGTDRPVDPSISMSPEERNDLQQQVRRRVNTFDEKIPSYYPNEIVREGKRRYQKSPEVTRQTMYANGEAHLAKRKPKPRSQPEKPPISDSPPPPPSVENRLEVQSIGGKCATLSRINRCSLRADLSSGFRRFASLPRFRKLDLAPLKAKITNALQRQT
ncbi:uncharacterized protein LOC132259049 [Phlebotomus argentipes]|uniref:uncharacterized protein LOC132259049 n=1 Tax=Phlebotomus argentipes TaxID=94469 RepID=UPI002892AC83|nr:uncharacterized protein LOC132259049 [Phlebotomus argentipes]